jgi:hypothetical protein
MRNRAIKPSILQGMCYGKGLYLKTYSIQELMLSSHEIIAKIFNNFNEQTVTKAQYYVSIRLHRDWYLPYSNRLLRNFGRCKSGL